jgi:hypothetical protein
MVITIDGIKFDGWADFPEKVSALNKRKPHIKIHPYSLGIRPDVVDGNISSYVKGEKQTIVMWKGYENRGYAWIFTGCLVKTNIPARGSMPRDWIHHDSTLTFTFDKVIGCRLDEKDAAVREIRINQILEI